MVPILFSLMTLQVVVIRTCGAIGDYNDGIMMTIGFHCISNIEKDHKQR